MTYRLHMGERILALGGAMPTERRARKLHRCHRHRRRRRHHHRRRRHRRRRRRHRRPGCPRGHQCLRDNVKCLSE